MSSQPEEALPEPSEQAFLNIAPPSLDIRFAAYLAPVDNMETTYGLPGREALAPSIQAFAKEIAKERVAELPDDERSAQKQIPSALIEQQTQNYYRILTTMPAMEVTFTRRYAHKAAGRTELPQVTVLLDLYETLGKHSEADAHQENRRRLQMQAIKDTIIIYGKCVVSIDRYIVRLSRGVDDIQS